MRKLKWMADERKRQQGELSAWHLAGIVGSIPFTGKSLNPSEINPYKTDRHESPHLAKIKSLIAGMGLAALAGQRDED